MKTMHSDVAVTKFAREVSPLSDPLYIRREQVPARYGIGRSLFYELIAAGKLPRPYKVGRASLWKTDELDAAFHAMLTATQEPATPVEGVTP